LIGAICETGLNILYNWAALITFKREMYELFHTITLSLVRIIAIQVFRHALDKINKNKKHVDHNAKGGGNPKLIHFLVSALTLSGVSHFNASCYRRQNNSSRLTFFV
jgi:hypothetical protein